MKHPGAEGWHGDEVAANASPEIPADAYDDPARYDALHAGVADDRALYERYGWSGVVLELGAGTGRITSTLAAPTIVAVERSVVMANVLRQRAPRATVIEADFVASVPSYPGGFTSVLAPLNVLCHVDPDALWPWLERLREATAPDGRFVADLYVDSPALSALDHAPDAFEVPWRGGTRVVQRTLVEGGRLTTVTTWPDRTDRLVQHLLAASVWEATLHATGWSIDRWWSADRVDYDGGPKLIFVARNR